MSQEVNNNESTENPSPLHNYVECSCGKKNQEVDNCQVCKPKKPEGMRGWICPVCGLSPFTSMCPCVQPPMGLTIR